MRAVELETNRIFRRQRLPQPRAHDGSELRVGNHPHRSPLKSGADPRGVGHGGKGSFIEPLRPAQRDHDVEGQIAVHDRVMMAGFRQIRLQPSEPGSGHVVLPPTLAARLAIDNPVAERPPGLGQIAVRKMVAPCYVVVVTGRRAGVEDRLHTRCCSPATPAIPRRRASSAASCRCWAFPRANALG